MIHVYLINVYKINKDNGLDTYTNQIGSYLGRCNSLSLHYIWLNAINEPKPLSKIVDGCSHFYIPPMNRVKQLVAPDLIIAELIKLQVQPKGNIVFHFNWINHVSIAFQLKKILKCKIVLTKHCIPWRDLITNNYKEFIRIEKMLNNGQVIDIFNSPMLKEKIFYDLANHLITVTDCAKQSLIKLFKVDKHKITKIYNGFDSSYIKPEYKGDKSKLRQKYGFAEDEKLIIYAGNVNLRKGIFDVVANLNSIIKKNPTIRLLIAGPGNYEGILKLAKKNWSRITFLGSLDKKTLYNFYAMADIGIIPSYVEQCSYTCIEMMHSALPIIASNVDGLKEMVNENCGVRVKVDLSPDRASINKNDLINKLTFLIENPVKAKLLGKNAEEYARRQFDAMRMAVETVQVYKKVLSENQIRFQDSNL